MKQKHMGQFRPGKRLLSAVVTVFSLLLTTTAQAQTVVGASFADNVLAAGVDSRNINCDMTYHGFGGHLRVVAYDDWNTGNGYINLEDYTGGTVTIAIAGGQFPDVVIGDDLNNPGNDYIVGIVYGGSVTFFETYSITGTGTGSLTATQTSIQQLSTPGSATSRFPHIDLYPDINNWIVGFPALHEFVITWSEDFGSGMDIYAVTGDLMNPTSLSPSYAITSGGTGMMSDVAALLDKVTVTPFAYIPYFNTATNDLDIAEIDIAAASVSITSGVDNPVQSLPRIDAMSLYYSTFGIQRYEVLYPKYNGSNFEMWSYNDYTGAMDLSSAGFAGTDNITPAVSAGPGPLYFMPDYGNDNYTVAWHVPATQEFPTQSIDPYTGNISGAFPNYYIANQNPVTPTTTIGYYSPVAVSTATNNGSRLLTAWSGNGRVWYKYNGNTASYKTNSVEDMPRNEQYALYPNPATKNINIAGAENATYTIADVTGRILMEGTIDSKNTTIYTEALASGMYVASVTEKGVTTLLKFTRK